MKDFTAKTLIAQYTKRDLILYALGIGCCSDDTDNEDTYNRELQYVYENHPTFQSFPTYLFALSFVAEQQQHQSEDGTQISTTNQQLGFGIKPFPPESMTNYLEDGSKCGILPIQFFKNKEDAKEVQHLPILHMSQSLIFHHKIKLQTTYSTVCIDQPTQVQLKTRIISVKPKSIGTFVTSETAYYQDGDCIASAQMVALILGLDPDKIVPWKAPSVNEQKLGNIHNKRASNDAFSIDSRDKAKKTVTNYTIPKNAALLYRLSGDYNSIHVEGDNLLGSENDSTKMPHQGQIQHKRGPVLHGLCTLGYAMRAVLRHVHCHHYDGNSEAVVASVQCNFTKPVFVGDAIRVDVWDEEDECTSQDKSVINIYFCVHKALLSGGCENNEVKSVVVLDKGIAQFRLLKRPGAEVGPTISRL